MTYIPRIKSLSVLFCLCMASALALTGCNRDQIKVQEVPKDSEQKAQAPMMDQVAAQNAPMNPHAGMDMNPHAGTDMGAATLPQLGYVLPSGWKQKDAGEMRVGSFDAPGKNGVADVAIIPLPLMPPETELANLNMWRKSVGLQPADKVESQPVAIGSAQGKLYEVGGDAASGRIIVAALDRDGMSWYFKMTGADRAVSEQKPAFLDFLKSITFEAAPASSTASSAATSMDASSGAQSAGAGVAVPAGWTEIPNPQMLVAKYVIQGNGDARAEVNVSMLAGTGGGLMANVNRWRGQLGLPPISEEDFSKTATTLDLPGGKGTVVDMMGTDPKTAKKSRLIGVIVPQANDTWFYKLMGDEQIVEQQKDAFTKFIQSAKFSNAL